MSRYDFAAFGWISLGAAVSVALTIAALTFLSPRTRATTEMRVYTARSMEHPVRHRVVITRTERGRVEVMVGPEGPETGWRRIEPRSAEPR